jgi:hypothetical protein
VSHATEQLGGAVRCLQVQEWLAVAGGRSWQWQVAGAGSGPAEVEKRVEEHQYSLVLHTQEVGLFAQRYHAGQPRTQAEGEGGGGLTQRGGEGGGLRSEDRPPSTSTELGACNTARGQGLARGTNTRRFADVLPLPLRLRCWRAIPI